MACRRRDGARWSATYLSWSTSPTSVRPPSRPSAEACSSGSASPTRSSTTLPCCSSTNRPPASTRAPASSCVSCSASCARRARRSSSAPTSSHTLPELEELCTSVTIIVRGRVLASGRVADIEARMRAGAVLRTRVLGDEPAIEAAAAFFTADPIVVAVERHDDGWLGLGFRGGDAESAALLARAVGSGHSIATYARAASDLEELFLQVTAREAAGDDAGQTPTEDAR